MCISLATFHDPDTNHQDMEKSNKEEESLEKCVGSRNDEIIENNKREPVVPELRRHQGGRFGAEDCDLCESHRVRLLTVISL